GSRSFACGTRYGCRPSSAPPWLRSWLTRAAGLAGNVLEPEAPKRTTVTKLLSLGIVSSLRLWEATDDRFRLNTRLVIYGTARPDFATLLGYVRVRMADSGT